MQVANNAEPLDYHYGAFQFPPPPPPLSPQHHHMQQQQQQQQQHLPPVVLQSSIHNLRTLFSLLNDDEFESEVEIERQRRYKKNGHNNRKQRPAQNVRNNNNRKRTPELLVPTEQPEPTEENPRRKKRKNNVTLPSSSSAATRNPYAAAAAAAAAAAGSPSDDTFHTPTTDQLQSPLQPTMYFSPSPYAAAAAATANHTKDDNIQEPPDDVGAVAAAATPRPAVIIKKTWNEHYVELQQFRQVHGHVFVPHTQPEYASLYHWVALQKSLWRKDKNCPLTQHQINLLVQVGLGTLDHGPINSKSEKEAMIWEERFVELKAFKERYKTLEVPKDKERGEYYALARWVETQRMNFKNRTGELIDKKRGIMTADQLERLAALGFRFVTNTRTDFATRFQQISNYKHEYGHTKVPRSYKEHDNLGTWVAGVKRQFKQNKLSVEKVEQLNSIGFDFSNRCPPNAQRKKQKDNEQQEEQQPEKPKAKGSGNKKGGTAAAKPKATGNKKGTAAASKPKAKGSGNKKGATGSKTAGSKKSPGNKKGSINKK